MASSWFPKGNYTKLMILPKSKVLVYAEETKNYSSRFMTCPLKPKNRVNKKCMSVCVSICLSVCLSIDSTSQQQTPLLKFGIIVPCPTIFQTLSKFKFLFKTVTNWNIQNNLSYCSNYIIVFSLSALIKF